MEHIAESYGNTGYLRRMARNFHPMLLGSPPDMVLWSPVAQDQHLRMIKKHVPVFRYSPAKQISDLIKSCLCIIYKLKKGKSNFRFEQAKSFPYRKKRKETRKTTKK